MLKYNIFFIYKYELILSKSSNKIAFNFIWMIVIILIYLLIDKIL